MESGLTSTSGWPLPSVDASKNTDSDVYEI